MVPPKADESRYHYSKLDLGHICNSQNDINLKGTDIKVQVVLDINSLTYATRQ